MYICTHAAGLERWRGNDYASLEADAGAGKSARLLCSTRSTTFSTSNAQTSLYLLPETPMTLNPPPFFPTYTRMVHGPRASAVLPSRHCCQSRVQNSEEALCSLTMTPCAVAEKLLRKAAVHQNTSRRAHRRPSPKTHDVAVRENPMIQGSMQNNQNPQQHITLL